VLKRAVNGRAIKFDKKTVDSLKVFFFNPALTCDVFFMHIPKCAGRAITDIVLGEAASNRRAWITIGDPTDTDLKKFLT